MPEKRRGLSSIRDRLAGRGRDRADDGGDRGSHGSESKAAPATERAGESPAPTEVTPEPPAIPVADGSVRFVGDVEPAPGAEATPVADVADATVPDGTSNTVPVREAAARDDDPQVLLPFLEQEALTPSPSPRPVTDVVDGTSNTIAFGEAVPATAPNPSSPPPDGASAPVTPVPADATIVDGTSNTVAIAEDDELPTVVLDDQVVERAAGARGEERSERGQARAREAHEANEERRAARADEDDGRGGPDDDSPLPPPVLVDDDVVSDDADDAADDLDASEALPTGEEIDLSEI